MAKKGSGRMLVGLIVLALGVAFLLARMHLVAQAPALLLAFGGAFALYGIFRRVFRPLVPGCIVLGLGSGMLLGDWGVGELGVVRWHLLGLGCGFVLLFVLALILGLGAHWWALFVGGVLSLVALLPAIKEVLHPTVVVALRTYWPVVLIALGGYLVVREITR